jgi:hypothetical protein
MDEIDAIRSMINEKSLFWACRRNNSKAAWQSLKECFALDLVVPEDEEKRIQELQGPGLGAQRIAKSS